MVGDAINKVKKIGADLEAQLDASVGVQGTDTIFKNSEFTTDSLSEVNNETSGDNVTNINIENTESAAKDVQISTTVTCNTNDAEKQIFADNESEESAQNSQISSLQESHDFPQSQFASKETSVAEKIKVLTREKEKLLRDRDAAVKANSAQDSAFRSEFDELSKKLKTKEMSLAEKDSLLKDRDASLSAAKVESERLIASYLEKVKYLQNVIDQQSADFSIEMTNHKKQISDIRTKHKSSIEEIESKHAFSINEITEKILSEETLRKELLIKHKSEIALQQKKIESLEERQREELKSCRDTFDRDLSQRADMLKNAESTIQLLRKQVSDKEGQGKETEAHQQELEQIMQQVDSLKLIVSEKDDLIRSFEVKGDYLFHLLISYNYL